MFTKSKIEDVEDIFGNMDSEVTTYRLINDIMPSNHFEMLMRISTKDSFTNSYLQFVCRSYITSF